MPPEPGIAAPSSLQTIPSAMTMISATSQPSSACGPPSAVISSGIVMNGPMPIMFDMFSAVACSRPKRRSSGAGWGVVDIGGRFYRKVARDVAPGR